MRTTPSGSLSLRRSYLWGLDVDGTLGGAGGVGGLLWVADYVPGTAGSNRQLAPCYDGNGNIMSWVENEGGQVLPLHRLEYDPYGRLLIEEDARVVRTKKQRDLGVTDEWLDRPAFGFSTKYEDVETGLLYYGYRYYAPEMGRWISRDPIGEDGGVNLYGMVGNDSVNKSDYMGLFWPAGSYPYGSVNTRPPSPMPPQPNKPDPPDAVDKALNYVMANTFLRCYAIDVTEEDVEEINVIIQGELSVLDSPLIKSELAKLPITAGAKFLALNELLRQWTAAIPQSPHGIFGIPNARSLIASELNKRRVLVAVRSKIRDLSIKWVGKGGVKIWGRIGSKALAIVGWVSNGYEAYKACHCYQVTKDDGKFTNDEKTIGQ